MSADGDSTTDDSNNSNLVVLDGNLHFSDGLEETWPEIGGSFDYQQIDDSRWRSDLAQRWVAMTGAEEEGVSYILDKLPEGYCTYDRARSSHSGRDPFLFGHPTGRYFQSRTAFFPHFYWLVTGRQEPCKCHLCERMSLNNGEAPKKRRKRRTKAEMEAARAQVIEEPKSRRIKLAERPRMTDTDTSSRTPETGSYQRNDTYQPRNDEGPEYWKIHIMKLKEKGILAEEINHPFNFDWALTHEWLEDYFVRLKLQAAFVPRRGEVVLWTPELNGPLIWNNDAMSYMIKKEGVWVWPEWRAGVVTQTSEETLSFLDIVEAGETEEPALHAREFRVETLPDPLSDDKTLSLQYKYVPLRCIKPFNTYERFLHGIPRGNLHPSIEHAMTTMASYSLLSHTNFTGRWPNARIYSRGIFIGTELIAMHDTVRLKPYGLKQEQMEQGHSVTHPTIDPVDVMVIEKIWLELDQCNPDPKDPQIANLCMPLLQGKVYTRDPRRLERDMPFSQDPLIKLTYDEVSSAFRQVSMGNYGDWYAVGGGRNCVVSPALVLGRCYEPEATALHFDTYRLDYDLHGILNGRRYSSEVDSRIPKKGNWFWGDCRVETLGLAAVNGIDVGLAAEQRVNPDRWQAIFRILNGPYSDVDIRKAELPRRVGRPSRKDFTDLQKTSKLVSSGLGIARSGSDDLDDEDESEMDLSPSELLAPVPFRSSTKAS